MNRPSLAVAPHQQPVYAERALSWPTTGPQITAEVSNAYDRVAADYADLVEPMLDDLPLDRALLTAFAEELPTGRPVVDLGCGPGHIAGFVHALGATVLGFDLSGEMVRQARSRHPEVQFGIGSLLALPLEDASVGGVIAWYSIIHTPTDLLPEVFEEFRRVLVPGGGVILAFQVGDEVRHLQRGYGHDISLHSWRRPVRVVAELLQRNGFEVTTRIEREPTAQQKVPQGYLMARRP